MESELGHDELPRDGATSRGISRWLRRIVAGLVFLSLFGLVMGGAHYYLLRRLALDPGWPPAVAVLVVGAMLTGFVAIVVQGIPRRHRGPASTTLAWGSYAWMGFMFYLLVSTAALDLLGGMLAWTAGSAAQAEGFARAKALGIALLAIGASALALKKGRALPGVKRLEVRLARLPAAFDGFRIVQISDIHIGPLLDGRFARHLTETVNALAPDLVAVTGDLVDGSVSRLEQDVEPFRELEAPDGVYFVTGNHDFYSGADSWAAKVGDFGWRPLRNRAVEIQREHSVFFLAGVDDPHGAMVEGVGGEDLDLALRDVGDEAAVILLAHDPSTFRRARSRNVDLQLSGHTHGGQIWPFHWLVRASVRWVAGLYREGDAQIYVSCGTGFWGPPMRLGTRSEITEFTLRPASAPTA